MRFIIIAFSLLCAFLLAKKSNFFQTKVLSKVFVISLLVITFLFILLPTSTTNLETASFYIKNKYSKPIPILIQNNKIKDELQKNKFYIENEVKFELNDNIKYNKENFFIAKFKDISYAEITEVSYKSLNFYFPFIAGLENSIKLFPIHVGSAWVAFLGFVLSLLNSIQYLRTKVIIYDRKSFLSSKYGFIFCIMATILGMIWAKHSWGAYWNWDPRQISIFLLLSIYLAYFVLRQSIIQQEKKARFSAVYSIFAGFSSPFLIFILPRISSGLHPGASNGNSSPLISSNQSMMNDNLFIVFAITLFTFTILFLYLYYSSLKNQKNNY